MNMKQLRKIHRNKFTEVEEREIKKGEYERVRVNRPDYISFKAWLRSVQPDSMFVKVEEITGKAMKIRGGK